MKALVTGGAGFIGSHVAEQLLAAGYEVHLLDDLSNGKAENVPEGATLHVGSITDAAFVDQLFAELKPDRVFHLAAQVSVIVSTRDPFDDMQRNIGGSLNIIQAARNNGQPKIVYAATGGAAYGDPDPSLLPVSEAVPARPLAPYGITKHTVEHYLDAEGVNHGQRWTVLRLANVYGPRQDPHGEAGVVAIFTKRLLEGQQCTIFGDGEQTRDFIYVGDVAAAFVKAADRADGEIMNIGTAIETSVNQVVEAINAASPAKIDLVYAEARSGEVKRIALANDKARKLLDWSPQVNFKDGIKRTLDSFLA